MQKFRVLLADIGRLQLAAEMSANSEKVFTFQVLSVLRASPARTPPGPNSQNSVAPAATLPRMQSSQRTEETTCLTSAAFKAAGSRTTWPVVLLSTVSFGALKTIEFKNVENAARAGSIKRE